MIALAALWGVATAACLVALIWSAGQPGAAAHPPQTLPASLAGARTSKSHHATVIVALHPHCPCSRATVANLESAWSSAEDSCDLVALVYTPSERPADWAETDTVQRTAALRGARRIEDRDGVLSASLGIATSGQVLIYSASGELEFAGGITPSRGHEGDCEALDSFKRLTSADPAPAGIQNAPVLASVFGCPLCDDAPAANPTTCDLPHPPHAPLPAHP